jgi:hypothetical protein
MGLDGPAIPTLAIPANGYSYKGSPSNYSERKNPCMRLIVADLVGVVLHRYLRFVHFPSQYERDQLQRPYALYAEYYSTQLPLYVHSEP